jgi:hypothetical protein
MAFEGIPCPLPARLAEPFVQAKRCRRGRPRQRRCRPCSLRGPTSYCHQHCACGLLGRAATTSRRAISSRREWRPPGKARSRRRASPSSTQGSQRSAGGPRLMPPRSLSCNLLVDSGIQGLAADMLCPDTHLPTPADWRDEMSLSASEIEKAKSRTKPETPKHYTEEVLPRGYRLLQEGT